MVWAGDRARSPADAMSPSAYQAELLTLWRARPVPDVARRQL